MKRGREAAQRQHGEQPKRIKLSVVPRVVSWGTWDEWHSVRNWLWSADPEERQRGLRRVRIWRARGPLPLSIEATASLIEAHASDTFPPTRPSNELRLMYAMAIVRMVNGLAEVEQKGVFARSVWGIAQHLGLPRSLVDLRHSATHSTLPSLPSLRFAAYEALQWLDAHYWKEQENSLAQVKASTQELLQRYLDVRERRRARDPFVSRAEQLQFCITGILEKTSSNLVREVLVPMLVKNNFLLPRNLQRTKLMWPGQKTQISQKKKDGFYHVTQLWAPLLEACVRQWNNFLGTLLANILEAIMQLTKSKSPSPNKANKIELWIMWMRHLLYARHSQALIDECGIQVPALALLQTSSKQVSAWTTRINRLLLPWLSNQSLDLKMQRLLRFTSPTSKRSPKSGNFDLDVFERLIGLIKQHGVTSVSNPGEPSGAILDGPWKRCEGWTPCSVGLSVANDFPDLQLPRELDLNGAISLVPAERPIDPLSMLPFSKPSSVVHEGAMDGSEAEDQEEDSEAPQARGGKVNQEESETIEALPSPSFGPETPVKAALLFSPMDLVRL